MDEIFKYDCNLNIEGFIHMLDDSTECYKFYWLDSIMQLLSEKETEFTFDKVISGMIADAWYSVTEYHLKLGTKDKQGDSVNSIERAINKIELLDLLENTADRASIMTIIEEQDDLLHNEKYQITKNVPYRLLSPFFNEIGGNDSLWDKKARLIAYMNLINQKCCMPYTITNERGLNRKIIIDSRWKKFLIDNMVPIRGWIKMKKIQYLQNKNPNVPGIINKLEPEEEKQRKLGTVRKLWTIITELQPIRDIYSDGIIEMKQSDIDHFIPWSYISNDEMWNLMPVNESSNSSKKDCLPNWNKYFRDFALNQYELNSAIYRNEFAYNAFADCKRDNLNTLWSTEKLYIEGIGKKEFYSILEDNLKPIYDAAFIQGYKIWA
ncbi:MAG: HNH endonuclease domain-containing protein [Eubacteriales bacterium]